MGAEGWERRPSSLWGQAAPGFWLRVTPSSQAAPGSGGNPGETQGRGSEDHRDVPSADTVPSTCAVDTNKRGLPLNKTLSRWEGWEERAAVGTAAG